MAAVLNVNSPASKFDKLNPNRQGIFDILIWTNKK